MCCLWFSIFVYFTVSNGTIFTFVSWRRDTTRLFDTRVTDYYFKDDGVHACTETETFTKIILWSQLRIRIEEWRILQLLVILTRLLILHLAQTKTNRLYAELLSVTYCIQLYGNTFRGKLSVSFYRLLVKDLGTIGNNSKHRRRQWE